MDREKTDIPLARRLGLVKRRIAISQRIQQLMDPLSKKARFGSAEDSFDQGPDHGIRQLPSA